MRGNLTIGFWVFLFAVCCESALAATGEIERLDINCHDNKIIVSGSYIVTEDETPRLNVPDSPYCSFVSERYPAHYVPFVVLPMSNRTHAYLQYTLDGSDPLIISRVESSYLSGWSQIGHSRSFSREINVSSLSAGDHDFSVTLQDWFGVSCYSIWSRSYGYLGGHWGDVMDTRSIEVNISGQGAITCSISGDPPSVSSENEANPSVGDPNCNRVPLAY
ncbi:MAG: hypothetical protein OEY01_15600 [Desulfobulbaceae bacterium]|nr:hypothetical protein [Desulfobulbaceae bacterium]